MRLIPHYRCRLTARSLLLLLVLPLSAHAQDAAVLEDALSRCYAISSVATRIDCYDALARSRQVDAKTSVAAPASTATQSSAASSAAPAADLKTAVTASAEIESRIVPGSGQQAMITSNNKTEATVEDMASVEANLTEVARFGQQATVTTGDEAAAMLTDTVAAVRQVEPTKIQVTLASGQIWRQTVGKRYLVREGDTVHIRGSKWGKDYRLNVDERSGYIQVSRQQ